MDGFHVAVRGTSFARTARKLAGLLDLDHGQRAKSNKAAGSASSATSRRTDRPEQGLAPPNVGEETNSLPRSALKRPRPQGGLIRSPHARTAPAPSRAKAPASTGASKSATMPAAVLRAHVEAFQDDEAQVALDAELGSSPFASVIHPAPEAAPPAAREFAPYEIMRDPLPLAKGKFGTVYLGNVSGVDGKVVVKDIAAVNERTSACFRKEVAIMEQHRDAPSIARIIGHCRDDNTKTLTIVMEYLPGGDLFSLLHKTRPADLTLSKRLQIAKDITVGLDALHRNGVLHRDVKSLNILMTNDYRAKLTDFGLSRQLEENADLLMTMRVGTPLWMAPELRRGGRYDQKADIFSLGLVFYELFAGKLPDYNTTTESAVLPTQFPLASLVRWLLHPESTKRPTAAEVIRTLDLIVKD